MDTVQVEKYKILLGCEIKNFLDGAISFEELENRISKDDLHNNIKNDEIIKLIWHAIYQYETDININDLAYAQSVINKMRDISSSLINSDPNLSKHLDDYFNNPMSP